MMLVSPLERAHRRDHLANGQARQRLPILSRDRCSRVKDGRFFRGSARQVCSCDLKSGSAQKVGGEGEGPGQYSMPMMWSPFTVTNRIFDHLSR